LVVGCGGVVSSWHIKSCGILTAKEETWKTLLRPIPEDRTFAG